MSEYDSEKLTILEATHWLAEHGYLGKSSSGGNLSLRIANQDAIAITPSGRPYFSCSQLVTIKPVTSTQ
jgi:ribulose-5-phosphate 4-epimerase/fuculose-1-phosphate aldolase